MMPAEIFIYDGVSGHMYAYYPKVHNIHIYINITIIYRYLSTDIIIFLSKITIIVTKIKNLFTFPAAESIISWYNGKECIPYIVVLIKGDGTMYGQDKFYNPSSRKKEIIKNRLYRECLEPAENIKAILENSAEKFANNNAFGIWVSEGKYRHVTYRQFKEDVDGLGTSLIELGLKGKHIGVIGDNCYEWCLSWMSVVCGTGVVCNLDKELSVEELDVLIEKGDIDAIIFSQSIQKKMDEVSANNPDVMFICMQDNGGKYTLPELLREGKAEVLRGRRDFVDAEIDRDAFAVLLFTSGTSGMAKGVMLSHKNICFDIWAMDQRSDLQPDDVFLTFLPLHHIFQCSLGFVQPVYAGCCSYFSRGIRHLMKELQEVKPTMFFAVPLVVETIYTQMMVKIKQKKAGTVALDAGVLATKALSAMGVDLQKKLFKSVHDVFGGRLRFLMCGAAPLLPVAQITLRNMGITIGTGYGLTETSPVNTSEYRDVYRPGSSGPALTGIRLKIDNPDENGIGEICVKGDNVMLGYYKDRDATDAVIKNGWFHSGDLGRLDEEGWLYVTGREKNIIVLKNGKKISPEEMETLITRETSVLECIVEGEEDPATKEVTLMVTVVPDYDSIKRLGLCNPDDSLAVEELVKTDVARVNKNLVSYKRISKVVIRREEFVKTTTKKIKRYMK